MHFEGDAIPWMDWFDSKYPTSSWSQFMEAFLCHFGAKGGVDFNGVLSKLEQGTRTVEEYETEFLRLACRLPGWTDNQLKGCYISGLEKELQFEVSSFEPTSLTNAMKIARLQEGKVKARRSYSRWNGPRITPPLPSNPSPKPHNIQISPPFSSQSIPRTYPHSPTSPNPTYSQNYRPPNRPIRRMTNAEMQEKRDKNLCFKCDEPYRPGHQCKRAQLLVMEAEEDQEQELEESVIEKDSIEDSGSDDSPTISLHALTGSVKPQTMRIEGTMGSQKVSILVDSGSTHNFLHPSLMRLPYQNQEKATLKVSLQMGM